MRNILHSYRASHAIWDHSVACHPTQVNVPSRARRTQFTYPGGMESWVDVDVGYIPRWFTCPQTS